MKVTIDEEKQPIVNKLTITQKTMKMMGDMGAADYARQQAWDVMQAAAALGFVAQMVSDEVDEPYDMTTLADIMLSLVEFIKGEINQMENAAVSGITKSVPAEAKTELNTSYAKSLGVEVPELAVKYVAKDQIKGYTFLWGNPKKTDLDLEYFTPETNFWDDSQKASRFLTWDHGQDEEFKGVDVRIGQISEFGDDEIGRWYVAHLDKSHKFRKAIDALIESGGLGTSSDSAPQYVQRVKTGKSTWLKEWPWFASALTDVPCEPRMIGSIEVLKSWGITLPDANVDNSRFIDALQLRERELRIRSIVGV